MPVIKRYPNRKLYDTEAKQYVTLEGLADLIRHGREVQVVDHATGEDLTAVTLTQIIVEQEKKGSGFLPQALLTGLIRSGGETLSNLRRTLSSSLELFHQVDEEIERRIQALITRGELAEEEGRPLLDKLLAQGRLLHTRPGAGARPAERDLELVLAERGVPSHEDWQRIVNQLDMLTAKLDGITQSMGPDSPS
jgi:polyhydroxyalkanoate synthesis repressor PhaR